MSPSWHSWWQRFAIFSPKCGSSYLVLSALNKGSGNTITICFLKMRFCVQILFFGPLLEFNRLVIISPSCVKIYEHCEMFKTNCWNFGERRGKEHQALLKPTVLHLDSPLSRPQVADWTFVRAGCAGGKECSKYVWNSPFQRWLCDSASERWHSILPFQTIFIITAFLQYLHYHR